MDPRTRYAKSVLDRYRTLPGTLRRALRQDRNLALRLYDRGVTLQKIEDAFVLALARRTFRSRSTNCSNAPTRSCTVRGAKARTGFPAEVPADPAS